MQKIGLFDSGVGGLSVLKDLIPHFSQLIYFADTLHLPYGEKKEEELKGYCTQIQKFLFSKSVDSIIIACNTASALFMKDSHYKHIPLFNIITPTVDAALALDPQKIGILATSLTVSSKVYPKLLSQDLKLENIYQQEAPLLADTIEKNILSLDKCFPLLKKYLDPLVEKDIDTLILGCAHYSFLMDEIKKMFPKLKVICSGGKSLISSLNPRPSHQNPSILLYVSKQDSYLKDTIQKILDPYTVSIQQISLRD